ncbi:hypothetical protein E2C01_060908 [Portunus trituberculatus]|uniref:Uncharacterized protein n=1 Tax=Portunus trituberculatus TaxID=210409 RepID=A0A5B7HAW6_PORTR|nr:hypothetical protein [Portunus trituberculatus]
MATRPPPPTLNMAWACELYKELGCGRGSLAVGVDALVRARVSLLPWALCECLGAGVGAFIAVGVGVWVPRLANEREVAWRRVGIDRVLVMVNDERSKGRGQVRSQRQVIPVGPRHGYATLE